MHVNCNTKSDVFPLHFKICEDGCITCLFDNIISMRSQVVAGTNYLMKIQVSEAADGFIHVKIYEPLPYTGLPAELHEHSDIVTGKKLEDPIEI